MGTFAALEVGGFDRQWFLLLGLLLGHEIGQVLE